MRHNKRWTLEAPVLAIWYASSTPPQADTSDLQDAGVISARARTPSQARMLESVPCRHIQPHAAGAACLFKSSSAMIAFNLPTISPTSGNLPELSLEWSTWPLYVSSNALMDLKVCATTSRA